MLKRHCDHSRKILRIPRLIKLVSRLTVQVRQRRPQFRRNGPVLGRESEGRLKTEMVLFVNRRIARVGMLVITLRQQHNRADVHRVPPEPRQHFALNLDVLHPGRVWRHLDWRDRPRQTQLDFVSSRRIQMHLLHLAIQVSRRPVEVLPLPLVHVQPDPMSIRAMKLRINIQDRLHEVITRGNIP